MEITAKKENKFCCLERELNKRIDKNGLYGEVDAKNCLEKYNGRYFLF